MVFNDTTNYDGIIQSIEYWTGIGDAVISGDATQLKKFTSRTNRAFDRLMPRLLSWSTYLKWDDANNTDLPIATFTLASAQSDYTFTTDDNSLDVLNIVRVEILPSATATLYTPVEMIDLDDPRAAECLQPPSTATGAPSLVLKRGNTLHFNTTPGYDAIGKIYFERQQSYFTSADTTKEPGFSRPFHELLPLYVAEDWLAVNKPSNTILIQQVKARIATLERDFDRALRGRYPRKAVMTMRRERHL